MDSLPLELIQYIYERATHKDWETARQLCLVNGASYHIALPLLYKHICLSGTNQIERFNAALRANSQIRTLIEGVTLLDEVLAVLPFYEVEDAMHEDSKSKSGWIKHWRSLLRNLGTLSAKHHLSTLVLSSEACARLQYRRPQSQRGAKEPLGQRLGTIGLHLDHLVLSHTKAEFFLSKISTRKLTWYGCDFWMGKCSLDLQENGLHRYPQLKKLHFLIGNVRKQRRPSAYSSLEDDQWSSGSDPEHQNWLPVPHPESEDWINDYLDFLANIGHLDSTVYCHRGYRWALCDFQRQAEGIGYQVYGRCWGKETDQSQEVAVLRNFYRMGWVSKKPIFPTGAKIDGQVISGKENFPGRWKVRDHLKKQWCGCNDLEYE